MAFTPAHPAGESFLEYFRKGQRVKDKHGRQTAIALLSEDFREAGLKGSIPEALAKDVLKGETETFEEFFEKEGCGCESEHSSCACGTASKSQENGKGKGKPRASRNRLRVFKASDGLAIYGPASVSIVDHENDIITGRALKAALPDLMKRGQFSLQHTDILVGEILPEFEAKDGSVYKTEVRPVEPSDISRFDLLKDAGVDAGTEALFVVGKVYTDDEMSKEVAQQVLKGDLRGFSISGQALESNTQTDCSGFTCKLVNKIDKIALSAVTICDEGMNQAAGFEVIEKSKDSVTVGDGEETYRFFVEKQGDWQYDGQTDSGSHRWVRGAGEGAEYRYTDSPDNPPGSGGKEGYEIPDEPEEDGGTQPLEPSPPEGMMESPEDIAHFMQSQFELMLEPSVPDDYQMMANWDASDMYSQLKNVWHPDDVESYGDLPPWDELPKDTRQSLESWWDDYAIDAIQEDAEKSGFEFQRSRKSKKGKLEKFDYELRSILGELTPIEKAEQELDAILGKQWREAGPEEKKTDELVAINDATGDRKYGEEAERLLGDVSTRSTGARGAAIEGQPDEPPMRAAAGAGETAADRFHEQEFEQAVDAVSGVDFDNPGWPDQALFELQETFPDKTNEELLDVLDDAKREAEKREEAHGGAQTLENLSGDFEGGTGVESDSDPVEVVMGGGDLSEFSDEELDEASEHAYMMASMGGDPSWTPVIEALDAEREKRGLAEKMMKDGPVVHDAIAELHDYVCDLKRNLNEHDIDWLKDVANFIDNVQETYADAVIEEAEMMGEDMELKRLVKEAKQTLGVSA